MKTHSILLLLASATTIRACGGGCYNTESEEYPQQPYDNAGYPKYSPTNGPVNQGGYTPPGGYYDTHLVAVPTYPTYPKLQSYAQQTYPTMYSYAPVPTYKQSTYPMPRPYPTPGTIYTMYAPEPSAIGIPPTPATGYLSMTTVPYLSIPYVTAKINSSYVLDTSTTMYVTTSKYASSSTHSISTSMALPIQSSSASNTKEVIKITWIWMVAIAGVGVGIGLQIRF